MELANLTNQTKNVFNAFATAVKGVSVVSLIVLVILIIGVGIPITNQVIDTANLTGLTATIVSFIPTFMALLVLIVVARGME